MKKKLLQLLVCLIGLYQNAYALPVMNLSSPGGIDYTFFPDHQNPNLYYVAPNRISLANRGGLPEFSYVEYWQNEARHATIQALIQPVYEQERLERSKQGVLAINPNAVFAHLPLASSRVVFSGLRAFIVSSACEHNAGHAFDLQSCIVSLNNRGRMVFRNLLKIGNAINIQYEYKVAGVAQQADGSFIDSERIYQISGAIGGPELALHPELFRDARGNMIDLREPVRE